MPWTNISIERSSALSDRCRHVLLNAEMEFWKAEADRLARELDNIPLAVEQYGYVSIRPVDGEAIVLVPKVASDEQEA